MMVHQAVHLTCLGNSGCVYIKIFLSTIAIETAGTCNYYFIVFVHKTLGSGLCYVSRATVAVVFFVLAGSNGKRDARLFGCGLW